MGKNQQEAWCQKVVGRVYEREGGSLWQLFVRSYLPSCEASPLISTRKIAWNREAYLFIFPEVALQFQVMCHPHWEKITFLEDECVQLYLALQRELKVVSRCKSKRHSLVNVTIKSDTFK